MRPALLAGSRASGTLQLAERAINELLQSLAGAAAQLSIELQSERTLLVRYGMFHAHAQLPLTLAVGESPRLTLRLASLVVAVALKAMVRQPFIRVHGRYVTIELASIPELTAWRDLWKHVQHLAFEVSPGALRVHFVIAVTAADARPAR